MRALRIVKGIINVYGYTGQALALIESLENISEDFEGVIHHMSTIDSFTWDETPEGYGFWEQVHNIITANLGYPQPEMMGNQDEDALDIIQENVISHLYDVLGMNEDEAPIPIEAELIVQDFMHKINLSRPSKREAIVV